MSNTYYSDNENIIATCGNKVSDTEGQSRGPLAPDKIKPNFVDESGYGYLSVSWLVDSYPSYRDSL